MLARGQGADTLMEAEAIVMMMVGIALLYGGLAGCIGIAWFHHREEVREESKATDTVEAPTDTVEGPLAGSREQ